MIEVMAPVGVSGTGTGDAQEREETWTSPNTPALAWPFGFAQSRSVPEAITITGLDSTGIVLILTHLANWTSPPATASKTPTLRRLSTFGGGFLPPAERGAVQPSTPQEIIQWLHRESGLTWEQLARTLGVSRRSVHAWAGGQRVSGRNLERLSHVYFTIRRIPADSPSGRRHALFTPRGGLPSLFDSLIALARKAAPSSGGVTVAQRLGVAAD
jgi:hypothetical protein